MMLPAGSARLLDPTWIMEGLLVIRPESMASADITSYNPTNRDLSTRRTTTAWDGFFTVWPDINSYLARLLMYNAKAGESPALQFSH
jgi:hypothetical protein